MQKKTKKTGLYQNLYDRETQGWNVSMFPGAGETGELYVTSVLTHKLCPLQVVLCNAADNYSTLLGYCPQSSPLWPSLTVTEHLEIYAAVNGMKKDDVNHAIKR